MGARSPRVTFTSEEKVGPEVVVSPSGLQLRGRSSVLHPKIHQLSLRGHLLTPPGGGSSGPLRWACSPDMDPPTCLWLEDRCQSCLLPALHCGLHVPLLALCPAAGAALLRHPPVSLGAAHLTDSTWASASPGAPAGMGGDARSLGLHCSEQLGAPSPQ